MCAYPKAKGKVMKQIISLTVATLIVGMNLAVQAQPIQTPSPQRRTLSLSQQADALFDSGDFKGAIDTYNQALERNQYDASAFVGRGMARFQLGDRDGALEDLTQALQINPSNADAYQKRGGIYMVMGKKKQAQQDFQRADSLLRGGSTSNQDTTP